MPYFNATTIFSPFSPYDIGRMDPKKNPSLPAPKTVLDFVSNIDALDPIKNVVSFRKIRKHVIVGRKRKGSNRGDIFVAVVCWGGSGWLIRNIGPVSNRFQTFAGQTSAIVGSAKSKAISQCLLPHQSTSSCHVKDAIMSDDAQKCDCDVLGCITLSFRVHTSWQKFIMKAI